MNQNKIALAMAAFPLMLAAQTGGNVPAIKLSLHQAIAMALSHTANPRLELTDVAVRQAEARVTEEASVLLPSVGGYVSGQGLTRSLDAFGLGSIELPGNFGFPATVGPFGTVDARVAATQELLNVSARRHIAASRSGLDAAKEEGRAERNKIAAQVASRYIAVLRAARLEEAAQADVTLAEAWHVAMQHRLAAGQATALDVNRAAAQLSDGRQRLAEGQSDRVVSVFELLREMGLEMDTGVEFTDTLDAIQSPTEEVQQMVQMALRNRAELAALGKRIEGARLSDRAADAEILPSFAAYADFGETGSTRIRPTFTLGLTLRVPVFDGGRRESHRTAALAEVRQDELRSADLRREIELDVRRAYERLRLSAGQIDAAQQDVELANQELSQAGRRFDAGLILGIEIVEAQNRLSQARDKHVAAQYRRAQAIVELAAAMGICDSLF